MTSPKDGRRKSLKQGDQAGALRAALRRKEAIDLRLAGCTFEQIGEAIGVSGKTAHGYIMDGWERIQAETDEQRRELRDLELARINRQYRRMFPFAVKDNVLIEKTKFTAGGPKDNVLIEKTKFTAGGPLVVREEDLDWQIKASAECRKLADMRAKLLGLYAPTKIEDGRPPSTLMPLEDLALKVAENQAKRAADAAQKKQGKPPGKLPR